MEVTPLMIYFIGIADHVREFSAVSSVLITFIFLVFLCRYIVDGDEIPHLGTLAFLIGLLSLYPPFYS